MNSVIVAPADFIQQLKDALIPELKEQLKKEFQPKQHTEYLTIEEVCALFKITKPTLWRWRIEQKIPSYGIGNKILFKRNEVEEIIDKNKLS